MTKESNYNVFFTEEFNLCLNHIQQFFAEQGEETLIWWYRREDDIINHIETALSENPFAGRVVKKGSFKGLRRLTYGKSRHTMLNYIIYYAVYEDEGYIDVINILPSRSGRKRVNK